jgi:hypothetical protein
VAELEGAVVGTNWLTGNLLRLPLGYTRGNDPIFRRLAPYRVKPADQQLVVKTKEIDYDAYHSKRAVSGSALSHRTGSHAHHADDTCCCLYGGAVYCRHEQLLLPDDPSEGLGQVENSAPVRACSAADAHRRWPRAKVSAAISPRRNKAPSQAGGKRISSALIGR